MSTCIPCVEEFEEFHPELMAPVPMPTHHEEDETIQSPPPPRPESVAEGGGARRPFVPPPRPESVAEGGARRPLSASRDRSPERTPRSQTTGRPSSARSRPSSASRRPGTPDRAAAATYDDAPRVTHERSTQCAPEESTRFYFESTERRREGIAVGRRCTG